MTYNNMDDAYRAEFSRLLITAKTLLTNPDGAIDCVHEAFERALVYMKKHPNKKISGFILMREVNRAALKNNKRSGAYDLSITGNERQQNKDCDSEGLTESE